MEIEEINNMDIFDVLTEKAKGNVTKEEYAFIAKTVCSNISFV